LGGYWPEVISQQEITQITTVSQELNFAITIFMFEEDEIS
jgi:hypothetical protein